MAKKVEVTGEIIMHTRDVDLDPGHGGQEDFFLLAEAESGFKYPVYVSSSKFFTGRKVEDLIRGRRVKVTGKIRTLFSATPAGWRVIEKSDMQKKKFLLVRFTKALVPSDIEILESREGGADQ